MDVHTKAQRSFNMSRVRSKNTEPEKILFGELKKLGYKFKRHSDEPGKPDAVLPQYKVAIFVDGEFWHGKKFGNWKDKLSPFWLKKISDNICRDKKNNKLLHIQGWRVIHLWGRAIVKTPDKSIEKLSRFILKNRNKN